MAANYIEHAFEYGIDIRRRRLFLTGDVNELMYNRVQVACSLMDVEGGTIWVFINSYGGSIYDGFGIYDTLRDCKAQVITVGVGKIMSMGVCLLQAGDERVLRQNATVMLHAPSEDPGWDYVFNQIRNAEELKRLQKRYAEIVAVPMNLKPRDFIRRFEKSTFIDAEKAVAMGLADKVI